MLRSARLAPSAEQLFELAVRACRSAGQAGGREPLRAAKLRSIRCIKGAAEAVSDMLREVYTSAPHLNDLHPFYYELCKLSFNVDEYKICLARLKSIEKIVNKIFRESALNMRHAQSVKDLRKFRRSFFGRLGSLVESIDGCLAAVRRAQLAMSRFPEVNLELATVIIAGAPNVGKSSLLRALTRAKPEVKPYPFTTKNLVLGIMEHGAYRVQLVDTPGLLDTPLDEKSKIERQAILALRHLGDAAVFVVDPTETCGYPLDFQKRVYDEVSSIFSDHPIIVVANKIDIAIDDHLRRMQEFFPCISYLPVSAEKKINIGRLTELIIDTLRKEGREHKMLAQ